MTIDADKDALLAEYAAAAADERAAWQQWKNPESKEAERDEAYLRWKNAADRTKGLALRLAALKFEKPSRA